MQRILAVFLAHFRGPDHPENKKLKKKVRDSIQPMSIRELSNLGMKIAKLINLKMKFSGLWDAEGNNNEALDPIDLSQFRSRPKLVTSGPEPDGDPSATDS